MNVGHTVSVFYSMFILNVYQYFYPADLKEKKPDFFTLQKRESRKSWSNFPEYYTNDIKVNPTQKDRDRL